MAATVFNKVIDKFRLKEADEDSPLDFCCECYDGIDGKSVAYIAKLQDDFDEEELVTRVLCNKCYSYFKDNKK